MSKKMLVFLLVPFLLFSAAFSASADKKEERLWEDEIVYSLMVDRFNNGNSNNDEGVDLKDPAAKFQGGDFRGITQELDYLKDMGFTTIILSPVFKNGENGYHGEWVEDFYETDPHFGTMDELKELVEEAHKKDLKVMFEFVTNHVGPNHPWTSDPSKADWFKNEGSSSENVWLKDVPLLDQSNEEVKAYLIDAAKWWVKETGVDGYSLSSLEEAPLDFWQDFASEVRAENDQLYLVGSVAEGSQEDLSAYQKVGINLADSGLNKLLRKSFSTIDVSSNALIDTWKENVENYPEPLALGAYFDNKDMDRFTKDMVDNKQFPGARWKIALFYLYTQPEVPIVFYGSEIAVNGTVPPDNVPMMNFRADEELMEFIGKIGKIRQDQPALTRGNMELLYEKDGMIVFKREYKGDTIVAAINNTTQDQTIKIPAKQLENNKELRGLFDSDLVKSNKGEYKLVINREMMEVYKLADVTGYNIPFILAMIGVFVIFALFMYVAWRRGKNRNPYENT